MRAHGADYSVWQDDNSTPQQVNFEMARDNGLSFVHVKISQGDWIDSDYIYNWNTARLAALPRGGYHYLTWDRQPEIQAAVMAAAVANDRPEICLWADYEKRTGHPGKVTSLDYLRRFLIYLENHTPCRLGIYTSPSFWAEYGSTDPYWKRYELWLGHYNETPRVPAPWTAYRFWQYTSHGDGILYGAESLDLDLNWYNGTYGEMHAWIANQPPPPAQPMAMIPHRVNIRVTPNGIDWADAQYVGAPHRMPIEAEEADAQGRIWYKVPAYVASWVVGREG